MGDKDWQANYQKVVALVESGSREIFMLVNKASPEESMQWGAYAAHDAVGLSSG
jgi:hypothetical protein